MEGSGARPLSIAAIPRPPSPAPAQLTQRLPLPTQLLWRTPPPPCIMCRSPIWARPAWTQARRRPVSGAPIACPSPHPSPPPPPYPVQDPDLGSVGLTAAACVYALFYFGVCLRMVWSDVVGMARCAGLCGRADSMASGAPQPAGGGDGTSAFTASAFTTPLRPAEAPAASAPDSDGPLIADRLKPAGRPPGAG